MTGNSTVGALGNAAIGGGAVISGVAGASAVNGILPSAGSNIIFTSLTAAAIAIASLIVITRVVKIYKLAK